MFKKCETGSQKRDLSIGLIWTYFLVLVLTWRYSTSLSFTNELLFDRTQSTVLSCCLLTNHFHCNSCSGKGGVAALAGTDWIHRGQQPGFWVSGARWTQWTNTAITQRSNNRKNTGHIAIHKLMLSWMLLMWSANTPFPAVVNCEIINHILVACSSSSLLYPTANSLHAHGWARSQNWYLVYTSRHGANLWTLTDFTGRLWQCAGCHS